MASKYIPSWEMQMRLHKPLSTATAVFMAAACSGGNAARPGGFFRTVGGSKKGTETGLEGVGGGMGVFLTAAPI